MRVIPSIFPNPIGNLVIGAYPHRMSKQDASLLCLKNRRPFMLVEMQGEKMVVKAAMNSFEQVLPLWREGRWVVFPVGYDGPTSMIYQWRRA